MSAFNGISEVPFQGAGRLLIRNGHVPQTVSKITLMLCSMCDCDIEIDSEAYATFHLAHFPNCAVLCTLCCAGAAGERRRHDWQAGQIHIGGRGRRNTACSPSSEAVGRKVAREVVRPFLQTGSSGSGPGLTTAQRRSMRMALRAIFGGGIQESGRAPNRQ